MAVVEEKITALEEVVTPETVIKILHDSESSVSSHRMTDAKNLAGDILADVQSSMGKKNTASL